MFSDEKVLCEEKQRIKLEYVQIIKRRANNKNNSLGMRIIVRYVRVRYPVKGVAGMIACA